MLRGHLAEHLLVLRCQTGDERAFEQLVARYSARLRYYLLKLVGKDAAEDVLQEVWLDVYRGIARLRDPAAFRTWIYRIARNRAFGVIRRADPKRQLFENEQIVANEDGADFTEEDAGRIHDAIELLSPEHREVLLLRFIEDLSYSQIAGIVGCSIGTVKSRIYYAKKMLRRTIEVEEESYDDEKKKTR